MSGMTTNDIELLRQYARSHSEAAFSALVSRHINLVYSVALRQVRDGHLAEEITQTVFVILARKADSLSDKVIVSGWLCQTARYAAAKALTMRRRREQREHQAFMDASSLDQSTPDDWAQIEPLLENAMADLGRKDHDALVLRFMERRSFKEVGGALGTTESAAKMRVNRALEKLRRFFTTRGTTLSVAVIAAAMSAHAVQAAPAGLAASVTNAALAGTAVTSSTLILIKETLKYMAWTKFKTAAAVGTVALLGIGSAILVKPPTQAASGETAVTVKASYATPEATVKSLIAALEKADTEAFAAACTPAKADQFRMQNIGKSEDELKREADGMAKAFSKYEILQKRTISATEIHLHIKATGHSPNAPAGDRNTVMRMKKIGSDWKFDGQQQ